MVSHNFYLEITLSRAPKPLQRCHWKSIAMPFDRNLKELRLKLHNPNYCDKFQTYGIPDIDHLSGDRQKYKNTSNFILNVNLNANFCLKNFPIDSLPVKQLSLRSKEFLSQNLLELLWPPGKFSSWGILGNGRSSWGKKNKEKGERKQGGRSKQLSAV